MSGQQAYIYNKRNKLLEAAISAACSASGKTPLVYPTAKQGNGGIRVSGAFEGPTDAKYGIKVVDQTIETPFVSAPIFRGAGTGKISDISADGLSAQEITVLCLSAGTDTKKAAIDFEGVSFQAKTAGADGNDIKFVVDDSGLVFTLQQYSTLKELKEGDTGLSGQEWDFDTKALHGDLVPDAAHRIAFGGDRLHIYTQYKQFVDGAWKYFFVSPIKYGVPAGRKVYFVTGGRTVTVTDGVTEEVYEDIVSVADLWNAIKDTSELVEPGSLSIDASRSVSGFAVRELVTKSDAYSLPPYASDQSSKYAGELEGVFVTNDGKTELLAIECLDNANVGAEIWGVKGTTSGDLGQAKTGEQFSVGYVGFQVPQKLPKSFDQPREDWSYLVNYASRGSGIEPPPICFSARLGINAAAQEIQFVYIKRPTDCACPPVRFGEKCLGFEQKGGEIGMAYTIPDLIFWTDVVAERMKEQFSKTSETDEGRASTGTSASGFQKYTAEYFALFKTLAQRIMALPEDAPETLATMLTDYKTLVNSLKFVYSGVDYNAETWQASHSYEYGSSSPYVAPTTPNGFVYKRYNFGGPANSGETEPTWPTTLGGQVTDGGVVWVCIGAISEPAQSTWDGSDWSNAALGLGNDVTYDTDAYQDLVDAVLTYETTYGVKKNSVVAAGGCYQDSDDQYYWAPKGSKAYLPAFTGVPYYSTVKTIDPVTGAETYVNTKEFACQISAPCGGTLLEGDTVTFSIKGAAIERTYLVGDIIFLPTIAASDLSLVGGQDGDDKYIFEVRGSSLFAPYELSRITPAAYSNGGLEFAISNGIIPFQIGDVFRFSIEGGHFKWRKGTGSWSAAMEILPTAQEIEDGLNVIFDFGVAPSFKINDEWEILALQENASANMTAPWDTAFKGTNDIVAAFAAPVAIDCLVIDRHTLPAGHIHFKASNNSDFSGTLIHDEQITVAALICKVYATPITAKYFKIVASSSEYSIGYMFLGNPMYLSCDADKVTSGRKYGDSRSPASDMPFYFMPNTAEQTDECIRARIDSDSIEFGSDISFNSPKAKRMFTITLPVIGQDLIAGLTRFRTRGYTVEYSSWITGDDYDALIEMLDYLKAGA
jgi:hypothetical protein